MSVAHAIYIPLCILIGLFLGRWFAVRAVGAALERMRAQMAEIERADAAARLASVAEEGEQR